MNMKLHCNVLTRLKTAPEKNTKHFYGIITLRISERIRGYPSIFISEDAAQLRKVVLGELVSESRWFHTERSSSCALVVVGLQQSLL